MPSAVKNNSIASMPSRFLAMLYDGLIILFISMVSILLIQLIIIGDVALPPEHILNTLLKPIWFVPGYFYLAYFWRTSGQTPGMKVWKIKLIATQSKKVTWLQTLLRYIFACIGLGLLLAPLNKQKASLQDILSRTQIIQAKIN